MYHETHEGLDLILEDDGIGIPAERKQVIFEYDPMAHTGIGLFICRQILGITGMTITENGIEGKGARFVIHVPQEGYRIEGTGEDAPGRVRTESMEKAGFRGAQYRFRCLCKGTFFGRISDCRSTLDRISPDKGRSKNRSDICSFFQR